MPYVMLFNHLDFRILFRMTPIGLYVYKLMSSAWSRAMTNCDQESSKDLLQTILEDQPAGMNVSQSANLKALIQP
jgi:hypothetical protein